MSLVTITRRGPEISDAIVSFDPVTLQRKPLPSVDIRSITSVLIFGPFTFIRPLVVLAGAVWGIVAAPGAITIALIVLIVSLMLGLEQVLSWMRSRRLIS